MKRLLFLVSALALAAVAPQANAAGVTGTNGGFYYFTYYTGSGTCTITFPNGGGNYKGVWTSGVTDSLCGKGWNPGSIRNIGFNNGQLSGSWHSAGAYGWAPYPQVEWYITEYGANSGTFSGTVNSDGGTYNVYKGQQGGGPQYKNDRQVDRGIGTNCTITMSNHVNKWRSLGWSFGTIRETVYMAEAFSGPGTTNATVW